MCENLFSCAAVTDVKGGTQNVFDGVEPVPESRRKATDATRQVVESSLPVYGNSLSRSIVRCADKLPSFTFYYMCWTNHQMEKIGEMCKVSAPRGLSVLAS